MRRRAEGLTDVSVEAGRTYRFEFSCVLRSTDEDRLATKFVARATGHLRGARFRVEVDFVPWLDPETGDPMRVNYEGAAEKIRDTIERRFEGCALLSDVDPNREEIEKLTGFNAYFFGGPFGLLEIAKQIGELGRYGPHNADVQEVRICELGRDFTVFCREWGDDE